MLFVYFLRRSIFMATYVVLVDGKRVNAEEEEIEKAVIATSLAEVKSPNGMGYNLTSLTEEEQVDEVITSRRLFSIVVLNQIVSSHLTEFEKIINQYYAAKGN